MSRLLEFFVFNKRDVKPAIGIACFILTFILVIACMGTVVIHSVRQYSQSISADVHLSIKQVRDEVKDLLGDLEANSEHTSCSPELIQRMREVEYRSLYLRDIGVILNNRLLCTTGLGMVDEVVDEDHVFDHDRDSDISIIHNVPLKLFDFKVKRSLVHYGHFAAILDKNLNLLSEKSLVDIAVYMKNRSDWILFDGDKNLTLLSSGGQSVYGQAGDLHGLVYTSQSCSQAFYSCVVVQFNLYRFFQHHPLLAWTMISAALLIALGSAVLAYMYIRQKISLDNVIRMGIDKRHIQCYYQPLVDLESRRVVGFEVLSRWRSLSGTLLFPDQFLPVVKRYSLDAQLTKVVMEKALGELQTFPALESLKVAFNFTPQELSQGIASSLLKKMQQQYRLPNLTIELTEHEVKEQSKLIGEIAWLREQGFAVAIDDFGTGYANLNHLKQLKVDALKIDKEFVSAMSVGQESTSFVPNIVAIAKLLQLDVVAEGIETPEQADYLKQLGIATGQGYLYARPVPFDDALRYYYKTRDEAQLAQCG